MLAVYDKVEFLDLRGAPLFLGTLDYILWDGNIGFCSSCKKDPPKSDLLFALYLVNLKKKILPMLEKKSFFCRNELHLVRRFQKGITLGVRSHISGFGWVVGGWSVVGCGRGHVPDFRSCSKPDISGLEARILTSKDSFDILTFSAFIWAQEQGHFTWKRLRKSRLKSANLT